MPFLTAEKRQELRKLKREMQGETENKRLTMDQLRKVLTVHKSVSELLKADQLDRR